MSEAKIRKQVRAILKAHIAAHGGSWYDFLDPTKNGIGDLYNKAKHEIVDPNSELRGTILPEAASIAGKVTPFLQEVPILGEVADAVSGGLKAAQYANQAAKMAGYGLGKPRATRKPTAHNLAVRKLMKANPDMKLGAASHIVKTRGLAK